MSPRSVLAAGALLLAACGQERAALSEHVRVDQVGYAAGRRKLAMVTGAGEGSAFRVTKSADGAEVYRGTLGPPRRDADSGDTVRLAEFSAVVAPGTYSVEVPGLGKSHPFEVGPDVHADALRLAVRAFYGQRCGTAVDLSPDHAGYRHSACHCAGTSNPDALFHASSGATGALDATGGWHDAGDYGKYVVNAGMATGELLWAWELFGGPLSALRLDIPESSNGTPDVLDEARWNLEWMLRMQDADGGVWHKLTGERFGAFVMPDADGARLRYVIGTGERPFKSSCATADLAAVMAVAARVFAPYDAAFADRALGAAERAWRWLESNPDVVFRNPPGVETGEYGDASCSDERRWAAAELFRTTGAPGYDAAFRAGLGPGPAVSDGPPQDWHELGNLAVLGYALSRQPGTDEGVRRRIVADAIGAARAIVARSGAHPYRVGLRPADYVWGSNGVAANYGVLLAVVDRLAPEAAFVEAAADDLHYLLGRNTFGLSWVTGTGDRPFRHPHHRPSMADGITEPWPGLLSGGPNRNGGDPVIDALPEAPPARRYADDERSFASNEVAINWNAALVFLLASQSSDPGGTR